METMGNIGVVSRLGGCQYQPHRLYSLWDMISFLADGLFSSLYWLDYAKRAIEKRIEQSGPGVKMTRQDCNLIWKQLEGIGPICEQLGLVASKSHATALAVLVVDGMELKDCSVVVTSIGELASALRNEVGKLQFAFVPSGKVRFFEQECLFGEKVSESFSSAEARADVREAGNCLAADLNTAAVFHLMRVAERGLRALAQDLGVTPAKPDYCDWNDFLENISEVLEARKKAAVGMPRSPVRDAESDYYGGLHQSLAYFREVYRNPVSHLRGDFTEKKAGVAFDEVQKFMEKLSERVKESN